MFDSAKVAQLTFASRYDWFEGSATWNQEEIRITFHTTNKTLNEEAIRTADSLWDNEESWNQKATDQLKSKMVDLWNDCWRQEAEEALSQELFLSRLFLDGISIDESGHFAFGYGDYDDLFGGHSIIVEGTIEAGLSEPYLSG